MKSLREALEVERNRVFVGREAELRLVQNWLTRQDAPTEVLFVSGMGGIGKSALILQFLNMAQNANIRSIWLDGRNCTETPGGFLEALRPFVSQMPAFDEPTNPTYPYLVDAISGQKTVLCVDNYENIHKIEGWLRGVFLPQLSATGLLVVLAARQNLASDWQHDLSLRGRVKQLTLGPLSRQEAQKFYLNTGFQKHKEIEQLLVDTQGLPLAMALAVERFQLLQQESESPAWPISLQVSAELLREVATSHLKDTLDILCILPQATPEMLGRLLGAPLSTIHLHQLSKISFVRPTVGGFALHDVARAYLFEDLLHRDPSHFYSLRMKIMNELVKMLKDTAGQEMKRLASVLLSTSREAFQLDSVSLISNNPDLMKMDSFRKTDLPYLHQIMSEEAEYALSPEAEHALLDALAESFPDSIRVLRSADGVPLVYTAGFLLYKETMSLLEHFIPGVLDAAFPLESKQIQQLYLEEADTYYQLLTGVTQRKTDYSYYELVGSIINEMIYNTAGLRLVIVTAYQETDELLRNLGFRARALPVSTEHPLHGANIHEQDWRGTDFGDHILAMLNASLGNTEAAKQFELTEQDLKAALPLFAHPSSLGQSELARKLRCGGTELQKSLQTILFRNPPFPLNKRKQELLRLYCEMPFLTPETAAERLHISRATYYRVRAETFSDLKDILIRIHR